MKIGISGLSGSGKTYISHKLSKITDSVLLSQDDYYFGCELHEVESGYDFDILEAIDLNKLKADINDLGDNKDILKPSYCFKKHKRMFEKSQIPKRNIIVEGNLVFLDDELFSYFDIIIFIDVPSELALLRRLKRDQLERGHCVHDVMRFYEDFVRKNNTNIQRLKDKSHIIINNQFTEHQINVILTLLGNGFD